LNKKMMEAFKITFLCLLVNLFIRQSSSYTFNGYEIKDLFGTGDCFYSDASFWQTSSALVNTWKTTMCNDSYPIMGGYNVLPADSTGSQFFYRDYANLPVHNIIYFSITIYAIDTWDDIRNDDDFVRLSFDSVTTSPIKGLTIGRFFEHVCGVPGDRYDLRNLRVNGWASHSANTLRFRVIAGVHQVWTDESLGFRDVNLKFATVASPTTSICAVGPGPTVDITPICQCPEGQYPTSTTACTDCHPYCISCYGGSASNCYQCKSGYSHVNGQCIPCYSTCSSCTGPDYNQCLDCMAGYFLYDGNQCVFPCNAPLIQTATTQTPGGCGQLCRSPCNIPTEYMYWDGSCNVTCPFPLKKSITLGDIPTCSFPCADGQFLYINGKCAATCVLPLLPVEMNGQQFCLSPCSKAGELLLWNSTCTTTCDFPLTHEFVDNVLYCRYPTCTVGTQYLYWDGSCSASCPSPLTPRSENGYLFCDFGLDDTTAFLYWNGSGASTCVSPLTIKTQGSPLLRRFCEYKCQLTEYLYWDGICRSSCDFPYVTAYEGERYFCRYPCKATEHLYWNGSCLSSCPSPYLPSTPYGSNFCGYTCSSSQYLYWDNSCVPSCAWPLKITTQGTATSLYCIYSCKATEFLYWNGTCSDECNFPLDQTSYKGKNFCEYPCASETHFLYFNGTCSENCLPPYQEVRENGKGFCNFPCSSTEFLFWNGTCLPNCDPPMKVEIGTYSEKYCLPPCVDPLKYYVLETGQCFDECDTNSTIQEELYLRCAAYVPPSPDYSFVDLITASDASYSFISMAKLSQHVRYLEVNQPMRLEALSRSSSRSIITLKFIPDMPEFLKSRFELRNIPYIFSRIGLHSNFIVNYWPSLMTLFIGIVLALGLWSVDFFYKTETSSLFKSLQTLFKWNFCFVLIAINVDDIIIFSYIDFISMKLDNSKATLSLFVILCMIILIFVTMILAGVFVYKFQKARKEILPSKNFDLYEKFLVDWRSWQVLYRGYLEESFLKQSFYILYMIRLGLPMLITITFLNKPVSQSVCNLIVSVDVLAYILYRPPFKKRVNYIQLVLVETFVLVINIGCLILAVKDYEDSENFKIRVWVGDVIVLCNFGINVTRVVVFIVKFVKQIYNIRTLQKVNPNKEQEAAWVRLLTIPLEQGAFGFEEILEDTWYARKCVEHPEFDLLVPPPASLYPPEEDESQAKLKNINDDSQMDKKEKMGVNEPVFHYPHNAEFHAAYGGLEDIDNQFYSQKIKSIKQKDLSSTKAALTASPKQSSSPINETLTSLHGKPVYSPTVRDSSEPMPLSSALATYDAEHNSSLKHTYQRMSLRKHNNTNSKSLARSSIDPNGIFELPEGPSEDYGGQGVKDSAYLEHEQQDISYKARNLSRTSDRSIIIKKHIGGDGRKGNTTIFNRGSIGQSDDL